MTRRVLLILSVIFSLAAAARADIPLPKNLTNVDPRVKFDGVDSYPEQVFYLRFHSFTGSPAGVPHTLLRVKDTKPFNLNAQRRLSNLELIAIPKADFEKFAKDDPTLAWLHKKTEGVLRAETEAPSTVAPANKEAPTTVYRIHITGGRLTVARAAMKSSLESDPPIWMAGLFGALAIAAGGLWMARRQSLSGHAS